MDNLQACLIEQQLEEIQNNLTVLTTKSIRKNPDTDY